jgi:DNA-directed RNA polymerase specialized sigma24 family protein
VLKIWGDLSMPEAAAVLGVSEKTFEHRYYRGLAALKEKLGGNPP